MTPSHIIHSCIIKASENPCHDFILFFINNQGSMQHLKKKKKQSLTIIIIITSEPKKTIFVFLSCICFFLTKINTFIRVYIYIKRHATPQLNTNKL
jgi:hypothetical protein